MNKLCIIGVGLIGGSIGIDVKKKRLAKEVVGVVRRPESIDESIGLGAVDKATLDVVEGVQDADLIVLATPISRMFSFAEKIKGNSVVIDIASVKGGLVRKLEKVLGCNYVGTHPMAGSERRGVIAAKADLFRGATCIITPTENTNPEALKIVEKLWMDLGSKIVTLSADEHDKLVALTSHLPHLVASCLVNMLAGEQKASLCIGTGFKDTTRIAASPPELWQEICEWNKDEILANLKKCKEELSNIEGLLSSGKWDELLNKLTQAKDLRNSWK